jgi:hypothetical protein
VVPTNTAAFLNPDSTYPHHVLSDEDRNDVGGVENSSQKNGMVVATFHTPQRDKRDRLSSLRNEEFFKELQEPQSLSMVSGRF